MMGPEKREKTRQGEAAPPEIRRRTAAEQIYEHHEYAHGSTHPEVYRRLGIPNPEEENSHARED